MAAAVAPGAAPASCIANQPVPVAMIHHLTLLPKKAKPPLSLKNLNVKTLKSKSLLSISAMLTFKSKPPLSIFTKTMRISIAFVKRELSPRVDV